MSDINKLAVKITGDESGLKKATKAAKKDIHSVGKEAMSLGTIIKGAAIGSAIGGVIAQAVAGIGRMIANEMDAAFKRFDALNNYSKVMSNLRVGTDDSSTSIAILDQKLRGLPTSLSDAALGVQRFTAANGNIQASTDMYLAFNNAILAGGAATETQATAMEQLIQAYSKGKADAQEWRAMLIAMPAQMKQIAEAMGYTSTAIGGDFQTALNTGKVSMNDFALTAIKLNKEGANGFASFADQAKNATNGVQTAISNMKIAIQRGLANIMQVIGQSNISGFFANITSAINTASNYIAAFITIIKEAVAWLGSLFGFGGGGSTEGIVKATEGAGEALAGGASAASGISDGLSDAAGNAKKLRQQLAGFDEMNVLQDKETGSAGGSGTGGGTAGGSPAVINYEWDTSGLAKAEDKIAEIANKIKKFFKDAFGEWNFDKIGKSIQKFVKQVQKFLEPIGKILSDIWTKYLAPFINWTGNELLPAFLNALGGAIELLGSIIGAIWGSFLEPFITNFLKPIAEFTGGMIVSVLTALGDALSWIAQQTPIVNFITDLAVALGAVKVAQLAWTAAQSAALTVTTTMNMMTGTLSAEMGTLAFQVGAATGNFELMATGVGAAATAGGTLKGVLTLLTSTAAAVTLGIGAVVAIFEIFKTAAEMADSAAAHYKSNQDLLTEATGRATQASRDQKQAIDDVSNAQLSANDAELRLLELTQEATQKREKYASMLNSGKYSQEELTKAQLEAEIAEGRLQAQMKTLSDKITEASDAQDAYHDAVMREISATLEAEQRQKIMKGDYESVYEALVDLTTGTHTFALKSGESYTLTAEEADAMAANILDSLDKSGTGFAKWLDESEKFGHRIRDVFHQIRSDAFDTWGQMEPLGDNFDNGVARGILRSKWVVINAARELANAGKMSYEQALRIRSPSRVMAKAGGYFAEGVSKGITSETHNLEQSAKNLGTAMVSAFNSAPKFADLGTADISDEFSKMTARAQATVDVQNATTNSAIDSLATAITRLANQDNHVTVKIGEETIIDKVVDGINNASRMRNQTVINL